jgi:hypothetical protein
MPKPRKMRGNSSPKLVQECIENQITDENPIKLEGTINFICGESHQYRNLPLGRTLIRPGEIVVAFQYEYDDYDVHFKMVGPDRYRTKSDPGNHPHVSAACALYRNTDGYLLIGEWSEEYEYHWWSELRQVQHFKDEDLSEP